MLSPPEALIPQTIGSFDHTIPLGFVRRNEDRLNAEIQTQADEAPENARRFVAATESRVVVDLQSIGQAQDTPRLQRMALNTLQTLVGADRLLQRTRLQIECMKGKDGSVLILLDQAVFAHANS